MSVSCVVQVGAEAPERAQADLFVAPCFEAERPLRGAAARIDWRLCGHVSSLLEREVIAGARGEVVLLPTPGRMRAPRTLLVGLGPRTEFRATALRDAVARAVLRAADLRTGVVAIAVPSEAEAVLASGALAAAVVSGLVAALRVRPFPTRVRLVGHPEHAGALHRGLVESAARNDDPEVVLRVADPTETAAAPGGERPRVEPAARLPAPGP